MSARQHLQRLRFAGAIERVQCEVGRRKMIVLGDQHQQRHRTYQAHKCAGLIGAGKFETAYSDLRIPIWSDDRRGFEIFRAVLFWQCTRLFGVFSYDVDVRSALTKNTQNAVGSELLSQ